MKHGSTIKKCLGLLYVSALGFSVVGNNKIAQVKAVEEYDTGIGMTGTWSLEENSGTSQNKLCFTETGNETYVQYFFNPTSATYYVLSETADILCSVYWINNGDNEDLQGVTAEIHLNNVSEPQINAANGTYPISGDFPNDSVSGVTFNVGSNNYTRSADGSDPHFSSTSDTGWVDEGGNLVYRIDEQTTADYYANYIEYHTEPIGEQQTRNEAIFFMRVYDGNDTLLEDAPVQISNPSFSPSVSPGELTFSGDVTGVCDATGTTLTLGATQIPFTYIRDGWSYDSYHSALIYNSSAYPEPGAVLDEVFIYADEIGLQYRCEKYGTTFTATLSNASYDDSSDTVTGDIILDGTQTETTVQVSVVGATIHDIVNPNYNNGWNYNENEHYIFWFDENFDDATYEIDSAIHKIESQQIIVTAKDTFESDPDEHTGTIDLIEYGSQENSVHGYMIIDSVRTEVEFNLGDVVPEEVEKWVFSNGTFTWINENGNRIGQESLTITSATFYNHDLNHDDDYFELVFAYQQNDLPTLLFNMAEYEDASPTGQGFNITGFCSYISINTTVTFNIDSFETDDTPIQDGWYLVSETFVYYYNNQRIVPSLLSCNFYQYGNSDNYCEIVYSAQIPGESAEELAVTITDAGYRTPQETQSEYYYVTGFYEGKETSLKVESLENHVMNHYEYDGGFVYMLADEGLELGCEVTYLVFNNYGNGAYTNEAYVTFQAFTEYGGNKEYLDDSIDTLYIENCVLTLDPRLTQDEVGTISGHWNDQEVEISFNNSVFVINDLQAGEEGLHYLSGLNRFVYFDGQGILYEDVSIESVTLDTYTSHATVLYSVNELQHETEFELENASYEDLSNQNAYARYFIRGYNEDLFSGMITFYSPNLYTEDSRDPYWSYSDGYLLYVDPSDSSLETEMVACIYFIDENYFELSYYIRNKNDGGYDTATILLTNAELGRDYNPNAEEPAERSGYISGNCNVLDSQDNYVTLIVDIEIQKRGNEPYWSYGDDYLEYIDPSNENLETTMVSCSYYEESSKFEIEYSIRDTVSDTFTVETIVLTNGVIVRDYDPTGEEPALRSGYISGICSEIEISDPITLIVDIEIIKISAPLSDPAWVYNEDDLALWWNDPTHEEYQTELEEAYYYERTNSVTFMYSIVTYTIAEQGSDAPTNDPVRTVVAQKTAHMNEITYEDDEELFVYVTGTCVECEDATTIVVPRNKFITATYDDDPGTITPDQQVDIKELLPEETSVDEQRMEESIVAISSETAHEIITIVNDAHAEIEAAKEAGTITQEQYEEKKEIIQTVTEVSVVVGAAQTKAEDDGKTVMEALPTNSLNSDLGQTLDNFYQIQMDALLGTNKAQKSIIRGSSRAPGQLTGINTNVSKETYQTAIEFVDTSVELMKDAALSIHTHSVEKVKVTVNRFISVISVKSFMNYDKDKAEDDFVEAVSEAIMLHLQQQVIEALKRDHEPNSNPGKEAVYQEQLEACQDFETFTEIVLEVLRLKYVSIMQKENKSFDISIDEFRPLYDKIFRSWALDDPSINPTNITLEELTKATIETTKSNASKFTYKEDITKQESTFLIILGSTLGVGFVASITSSILVKRAKRRKGLVR